MKKLVNVLLALFLIGGIVAVIVFAVTYDRGDDDGPAPSAKDSKSKAPIVYMSTDGVVVNIERRLSSRAGTALTARCPKKVNEEAGTKFRCSIRRVDSTDKIAIASVVIEGANGTFSWTSKSVPKSTPTPDPGSDS